ncbi:MAG TPA: hypothetical protein VE422_05645 [Terriglobia bacterium]|nr:hypothetical protein [Terriglobia bacterium]
MATLPYIPDDDLALTFGDSCKAYGSKVAYRIRTGASLTHLVGLFNKEVVS